MAQANTGVSDERVSLPQAPGSISGVGENATVEGNQGAMQYTVGVEVPLGLPGLTPSLPLVYASTAGASLAGMGWGMPSFCIERMTARGLQHYDLTDIFAVDGSTELTQTAAGTYRARFEGGFVRYTWVNPGTGEAGSWKAEFPDGRIGYYGADDTGAAVPAAEVIVPATAKVFRWHLVALQDVYGRKMKLTWTKDSSGYPLLDRVDYLFEGAQPRHSVRFTYEPRSDVLSDARPGFELRLTQRLKDIRIYSGTAAPEQIRRYALEYEPDTVSGFSTRLRTVTRFGRNDVAYPAKFSFGYTKTLGGVCDSSCDKPFVNDMGTIAGVDFSNGRASLIDINGDAIPDVVFSDAQGQHQFVYGKLDSEGKASFMATPRASAKTTGSSPFVLGDARVQLLDVNGDGFVDVTQAKVPAVLCNNGSGDWVDASFCAAAPPGLPTAYTPDEDAIDPGQQDPKFVRFFDYDDDKRIDWLRTLTGGSSTEVLANTAAGFTAVTVANLGAVFDESPGLQLADMNGDGLQDPVQLVPAGTSLNVQFKLNLGWGNWEPNWSSITVGGLNASQVSAAELEDINGDGLADIIMVTGNEVAILLNRNGDTFSSLITLTSASLGAGAIPNRTTGTTVTYADMNGNGSSDIVWIQANGQASYLELFPVRPHLISRIENGLGSVQLVSYGTSIAEQARDAAAGKPWPNRVPNASVVVTKLDTYVTLTGSDSGGLHETTFYRYHSGYYDGAEKQFRGYEGVEHRLDATANDSLEAGLVVYTYDVGKTEAAYAGRLLTQATYSLAAPQSPALLREERMLHGLCPVAEVTGTEVPPVKWACERATTTVLTERTPAAALTLREERDYDGYGNVIRQRNLGVVNQGTPEAPTPCAACAASGLYGKACGDLCLGDEQYVDSTFIAPTARWVLGRASSVKSGALSGALNVETTTFYDGPDFVGLPAGQLTLGAVTRVARRFGTGATDFIDVARYKRNAVGNVVEQLEPTATVAQPDLRRVYTYEPGGLWATHVEVKLTPTQSLHRENAYDFTFEVPSQTSSWYVNAADAQQTRYRYDEHGRTVKVLQPGDGDTTATTEYQYQLADPASKIFTLRRSTANGAQDIASAQCLDGKGRVFQTRQQLGSSAWQVSGFTEYDSRGAVARVFQPYVSSSASCDMTVPQGVPFSRNTYDALGRQLSAVEPGGAVRKLEYTPLVTRTLDENDNAIVEETDGLGRVVRVERTNPSGPTTASYDADGRLFTVKDAANNPHVQRYDLMGRLTQVTDPNGGVNKYEYDAASNLVKKTDARQKVTRSTFDALGRATAQWDDANEATSKVTWTWDSATGCTSCTNAGGRLTQLDWKSLGVAVRQRFGYDVRGNLALEERAFDGHALPIEHRYDSANRETATLFPGGLTVARTFDGASRITALPDLVKAATYNERGLLSAVTYANDAKAAWEYDDRLRLTHLSASTADAKSIFDLTLTRSPRGDVKTITDASTRDGRARHAAAFKYDAWNRVTEATLDAEVLTYAYDAIDNVTSATSSVTTSPAHVGSFTYDPARPNAVTKAGTLSYTYDAAGFMTGRGNAAYEYDDRGRLTKVSRDGTETGSFGFGPGPDRIIKREGDFTTHYVSSNFELRDGIAVVYARLNGARVARLQSAATAATVLSDLAPATGSGTLTPRGDGKIDIADAWLAQAAAGGAVTLSGGPAPSDVKSLLASAARRLLVRDVVWLHEDALGSAVAATDDEGAIAAEQSFYPYGELHSSTGWVDTYGFTGQERDVSTGLTHFQHRELDSTTGRWAAVDPKFTALSGGALRAVGEATTGYAYVANNFANAVDPSGLGLISKIRSLLGGGNRGASRPASSRRANANLQWHVSPVHEGPRGNTSRLANNNNPTSDSSNPKPVATTNTNHVNSSVAPASNNNRISDNNNNNNNISNNNISDNNNDAPSGRDRSGTIYAGNDPAFLPIEARPRAGTVYSGNSPNFLGQNDVINVIRAIAASDNNNNNNNASAVPDSSRAIRGTYLTGENGAPDEYGVFPGLK
ncbi:MAG: VCBS repeat-containing protein [Myxococcaceae bacterium]|nr:VCBS repeat-containing protein [Myxococcaceae bacterium]